MGQPPAINLLPQELLGKIFSSLPDEERCRVVPLVCRAWMQIHEDHTRRRRSWRIRRSVTPNMVAWFRRIAGSVERLKVDINEHMYPESEEVCTDCLPHLLSLAAVSAPRLRSVSLARFTAVQPVLLGVALLSQIRELTLEEWKIPEEWGRPGLMAIAGLSGLRSLEALRLKDMQLGYPEPREVATFWRALAKLPRLTSLLLGFSIEEEEDYDDDEDASFFQQLSLLTNLRALEFGTFPETCLEGLERLPACFSQLTQLTAFKCIKQSLSAAGYAPTLRLPKLRDVSLWICEDGLYSGSMLVTSTSLSRLHIHCIDTDLEELIDLRSPALPYLHTLRVSGSGVRELPLPLASSLERLAVLKMCGCGFTALPPAVARMPALQELDMSRNSLHLGDSDVGLLAGLTNLALLRVTNNCAGKPSPWSDDSMRALQAISKMLPRLVVEM